MRWEVLGPVFYPCAFIILGLVLAAVLFQENFETLFARAQTEVANNFGWLYVLTMNLVLGTVFFLIGSRFGEIRLGGQTAKPDFTWLGWFAMLFSAGMGIGLLFYGVAEPLYHATIRPPFAEAYSVEAAQQAMGLTYLHWGLHLLFRTSAFDFRLLFVGPHSRRRVRRPGNWVHPEIPWVWPKLGIF